MGLIDDPNAIVEGSVKFLGRELIGLASGAMRKLRGRDIAMIFQDPMTSLTPVFTIGWHISEQVMAHNNIGRAAARRRAVELLAEVNIPSPSEAVDCYPHQLSGGMRQRAMIAMALSCNPAVLIADEPTTALDVTVQAQILDLVQKLRRNYNSAIVFITHDMGVISEIADRVVVMYAGRIAERGSKSDLFREPRHPYTRALLDFIPPLTGKRPRRLTSIPGSPPSLLNRIAGCPFGPRCPVRFEKCRLMPDLIGDEHATACFRVSTV